MQRVSSTALVAAGLLLLSPVVARADVGAGVGASPVVLGTVAVPGSSYQLPALYVVNTGTVTTTYRVRVQRLSPGPQHAVPAIWVRVEQNDFSLAPKEARSVPLTLSVPPDAALGDYASDLVAGTVNNARGGGAVVGAQAATALQFHVGPAPVGLLLPPAWLAIAGVLVAALAAAVWVQRSYRFRIQLVRAERSRYRPRQTGFRFSKKALMPSRKSSLK
jgi:hypothetical protein